MERTRRGLGGHRAYKARARCARKAFFKIALKVDAMLFGKLAHCRRRVSEVLKKHVVTALKRAEDICGLKRVVKLPIKLGVVKDDGAKKLDVISVAKSAKQTYGNTASELV